MDAWVMVYLMTSVLFLFALFHARYVYKQIEKSHDVRVTFRIIFVALVGGAIFGILLAVIRLMR